MFGLFGRNKKSNEPDDAIEEPVERRSSDRNDIYADAIALTEQGRFLKKGIALDLSANGSRLRFENGDSLNDGMVVSIARYGIKRRTRLRWRTRTDVGVEFLDEAE
ncbi:MAG: hypothetical protein AAFQ15_04340 [Pseudomonadota bacterium]